MFHTPKLAQSRSFDLAISLTLILMMRPCCTRTQPSRYSYLRKEDVLISSIGFGSIGKVQVFDKEGRYGTVSEVTVVRQGKLNPFY